MWCFKKTGTRFPYEFRFPCLVWGRMNLPSSSAVSRFFGKGLILEQFDAMVMNIANSHRLSEANVWGNSVGPGLLNVLLVKHGSFSYIYIHISIYRGPRESRQFRGQDPEFIFGESGFSSWNLLFCRSAMYSPWFWPKRTRQESLFSEPTVEKKLSCFAEMWSQK